MTEFRNPETIAVHGGEREPIEGSVVLPIFQTSTFRFDASRGYEDTLYTRLSNTPNHDVLHAKLAALEGAEAALVTASGMAAISAAFLAVLKAGDHLLIQDCYYGGTHALLNQDLSELGITHDLIDPQRPDTWASKLTPRTRAIHVETLSNPLVQVPDLEAVVKFAREKGLVSIIDNTFASPMHFKPARLGFDLSVQSATKYLNGHSDLIAGCVSGRKAFVDRAHRKLNHLGGALDPHGCFLLHRGLRTLPLRMQQHSETALRLAAFLEAHPRVAKVHYPGLESHPQHRRARELLEGGFSGMLGFEPRDGAEEAAAVIRRLRLAVEAPSLGGPETLVVRPAVCTHAGLSAEERARAGISDALVRVSVGLEGADDLIADFGQAFSG